MKDEANNSAVVESANHGSEIHGSEIHGSEIHESEIHESEIRAKTEAREKMRQAEKAELIQAVSALYIPLSLFIACVIMAAGTFLVYSEYPVGWALVALSATIMISAFVTLFKFQNGLRVKGVMPAQADEQVDPAELAEIINKDLGIRFMPTVPLIPSSKKVEPADVEIDPTVSDHSSSLVP